MWRIAFLGMSWRQLANRALVEARVYDTRSIQPRSYSLEGRFSMTVVPSLLVFQLGLR